MVKMDETKVTFYFYKFMLLLILLLYLSGSKINTCQNDDITQFEGAESIGVSCLC